MPRILTKDESINFIHRLEKVYPNEIRRKVISYSEEKGEIFARNEFGSPERISIWYADANNDGVGDYLFILKMQGSGNYDYMDVYTPSKNSSLIKLNIFLQTNGYPKNVSEPPVIVENGKTYLQFYTVIVEENDDGTTGIIVDSTGKAVPADYKITYEKLKYLVIGDNVTIVSKTIEKKP